MRVGIIQSNYIPWRGYFDFIQNVDLFIFFDDVQYTPRDWRNRNRIKTANGLQWLSVPVKHISRDQLICDTEIDYSQNWQQSHLNAVKLNYARAPYVQEVLDLMEACFAQRHDTISQLNIALIEGICAWLDINTSLRRSSEFSVEGRKSERLIALTRAAGGDTYLSGPSARDYIEPSLFRDSGITLEYKNYDYPEYPQLWGAFEGAVSVIDLLANCSDAASFISSQSPNCVEA